MKANKDDVFTGLFVIIGLLLAFATISFLFGYHLLENKTSYLVRMEKLGGVKKGTLVKLKNFTVGEVTRVIPIYGNDIYFKSYIKVDSALQLYRGTKINITNQNVIGDTIMEIIPSKKRNVLLREGDTIYAGNIINLDEMIAHISSAVANVSELIESFSDMADANKNSVKMLLFNLNTSIVKVNHILDSSSVEIPEILKNVRMTTESMERLSKQIEKNPWSIMGGRSGGQKDPAALP